jgi:hypothetical protein
MNSNQETQPGRVFRTNPEELRGLLNAIANGKLALPEFQRNWVWEPDDVQALLVSIIQGFPAGSLMTYDYPSDSFQTREFAGASALGQNLVKYLVLDGQQRLTSLYQALYYSDGVHDKQNEQRPPEERKFYFFYLDLNVLEQSGPVEEAIFYVDETRVLKGEDRQVKYDLSTREGEFKHRCLPLNCVFDQNGTYEKWKLDYTRHTTLQTGEDSLDFLERFSAQVDKPYTDVIKNYAFPTVELQQGTPLHAICHIFERVNSSGVTLTVFELLTAILWTQGKRGDDSLRKMWERAYNKLRAKNQHFKIDAVSFLQTVALLSTYQRKQSSPRRAISCKRDALLALKAEDIDLYWDRAIDGYGLAFKIIDENGVKTQRYIPYATMLVPLAAMCAQIVQDHGDVTTEETYMKLRQWFWRSVFSRRYSSAFESRAALDFEQMMKWVVGGEMPDAVRFYQFDPELLYEITTIRNAVYSGVLCLLMRRGALDFKSGFQMISQILYDTNVDHHHIFPRDALKGVDVSDRIKNCIVNKTMIDALTNRSIGGNPPSVYLEKLEQAPRSKPLSDVLASHLIDKEVMRRDDFKTFLERRHKALVKLIAEATGS